MYLTWILLLSLICCRGLKSVFRMTVKQSFSELLCGAAIQLSSSELSNELDKQKQQGLVKKWSSVVLDYKPISRIDLSIATRTSFATADYLGDILAAAQPTAVIDGKAIVSCIIFTAACSVLLPQIPSIPDQIRGSVLFASLTLPFALLVTSVLTPDLVVSVRKSIDGVDPVVERERIAYHEAGHFLCGYLCGVSIADYCITGERDAGASIELPEEVRDLGSMTRYIRAKSGHLMVVAMAGVVSETLHFGDSKGGANDIAVFYEV